MATMKDALDCAVKHAIGKVPTPESDAETRKLELTYLEDGRVDVHGVAKHVLSQQTMGQLIRAHKLPPRTMYKPAPPEEAYEALVDFAKVSKAAAKELEEKLPAREFRAKLLRDTIRKKKRTMSSALMEIAAIQLVAKAAADRLAAVEAAFEGLIAEAEAAQKQLHGMQ